MSKVPHNVFSLCLGQNGGYFSLGGLNTTLHLDELKYIPFVDDSSYTVKLQSLSLNDQKLNIDFRNFGALVDSGTTITYFPTQIFSELQNQINSFCKKTNRCMGYSKPMGDFTLCYKMNENVNFLQFAESMPLLTFEFANNTFYHLKPQNYLFDFKDFNGNVRESVYCLGVLSWDRDQIILGTTWMHDHDIVFDIQHKRIGFAASECDGRKLNSIVVKENCEYTNSTQSADQPKVPEEKSYVFILFILAVMFSLIVFLLFAIRKLRRGQNFFFLTVANEEVVSISRNDVSMRIEQNNF